MPTMLPAGASRGRPGRRHSTYVLPLMPERLYTILEREQCWLLSSFPYYAFYPFDILDRYLTGSTLRLHHLRSHPGTAYKLTQKVRTAPDSLERVALIDIYLSEHEFDAARYSGWRIALLIHVGISQPATTCFRSTCSREPGRPHPRRSRVPRTTIRCSPTLGLAISARDRTRSLSRAVVWPQLSIDDAAALPGPRCGTHPPRPDDGESRRAAPASPPSPSRRWPTRRRPCRCRTAPWRSHS